MNDEVVLYFVVNKELNLSVGKLSSQIARVSSNITSKYRNEASFKKWVEGSQTVIVLQAKEKTLKKLIELGFEYTIDEGRTEIAENSLTVVGLEPMSKTEALKYIKRLQLYKG